MRAAADVHRRFGRGAVPNYIISNCNAFSDLLEVAVLLKEAGLLQPVSSNGQSVSPSSASLHVNIIPLFETIDDLRRGASIMDTAFRHPVFRSWLVGAAEAASVPGQPPRPLSQEIMLGYSDSSSACYR